MPIDLKPLVGLCPWLARTLILLDNDGRRSRSTLREVPGRDSHAWTIDDMLLVADRLDRHGTDSVFPPHPESLFMADLVPQPSSLSKRFLDIGVGSGVLSIAAAKKGWNVTGVDVNPRALEFAHINCKLNDVTAVLSIDNLAQGIAARGEQFDLCVANLPFEVTPAGCTNFIHSDGGEFGDKLVREALSVIPRILAKDGVALVPAFSLLKQGVSRLEEALVDALPSIEKAVVRLSMPLDIKLMLSRFDKELWKSWHSQLRRQGYEGFVVELAVLKKVETCGGFLGRWFFRHAGVEWILPLGGSDLSRPRKDS